MVRYHHKDFKSEYDDNTKMFPIVVENMMNYLVKIHTKMTHKCSRCQSMKTEQDIIKECQL